MEDTMTVEDWINWVKECQRYISVLLDIFDEHGIDYPEPDSGSLLYIDPASHARPIERTGPIYPCPMEIDNAH